MPVADVNGQRIAYDLLGDGEPVAFLNGVLMTMQSWVLQTSVFRRRYRCLMHDFRGQMLSSKPTVPWTLDDHVGDFIGLLDHLRVERCHLVGTSYGGEVGMLVAARQPERVASLTVVSSASEVDGELDRAVATWAETALAAPERLYGIVQQLTFSDDFANANPEVIELGEARLASCPAEFFPAFAHLVEAFRALDATAELARITCPTLVVVGELDALKPPACSRLIAERIEGAEFLVVPGAGHAVVLEKPQEINTVLLGFLAKQRMV